MQTDYLIVGVGNILRSDDGAGWTLAEQLQMALAGCGASVQMRLAQQLLPEMAADIADLAPAVLVVADCSIQADTIQLQPLAAATGAVAQAAAGYSHGLAPAQLLALAVRLYEFDGAAWLATAPGTNFAHGQGLSYPTEQAITAGVPHITRQLQAAAGLTARAAP